MTSVCPYSCLSYYSSKLRLLCAVILLSSVACLALPYFSTLSRKAHDFLGKKLLNIKCVFSLFSANFF